MKTIYVIILVVACVCAANAVPVTEEHEPKPKAKHEPKPEAEHEPKIKEEHESNLEEEHGPKPEKEHEPRPEKEYQPKLEEEHEPKPEKVLAIDLDNLTKELKAEFADEKFLEEKFDMHKHTGVNTQLIAGGKWVKYIPWGTVIDVIVDGIRKATE